MTESFSSGVKTELCRQKLSRRCCALAEAYGILLYCHSFSPSEIRIISENDAFLARLPKLFSRAFGFGFDRAPGAEDSGKRALVITDPEKLRHIFEAYGASSVDFLAHHINFPVLEEDCCRVAFIRGAFLAGGSVTDPQKRYHLELVTAHYNVSLETQSILLDLGFMPKGSRRAGNHIIYFKQSEYIETFLATIGAGVSAMELMTTKLEKDLRNSVNRRVNCDTANVLKTVSAAMEQTEAICRIRDSIGLEALPEQLRDLAQLRLDNPEASLAELAELSEPAVTKSTLYHRMKKLIAYSK